MDLPYVVCVHIDDHLNKFALDRDYVRMDDAVVDYDNCTFGNIVQWSIGVPATFSKLPDWAKEADRCITMWYNHSHWRI